jgi:hypothetical protein
VRASCRFQEVTPGWAEIEPAEGSGAVYPYFQAYRLCDASTHLTDEVWEPLRQHPPHADELLDSLELPPRFPGSDPRDGLRKWAAKLEEQGTPEAQLEAIQSLIRAARPDELPGYLSAQVPALFEAYPSGSLWLIATDELLVRRFAFLRANLAVELLPDALAEKPQPRLATAKEHSLTGGVHFTALFDALMLTFSPATIGFVFDRMPHALVLLFGGTDAKLIRRYPTSFASLYEPEIQASHSRGWWDGEFAHGVTAEQTEALLQWWVRRMNVLYSHALDPTQFGDRLNRLRPTAQMAWHLTVERALADALLIGAGIQTAPLARQQAAFDLFDKLESLLGFSSDDTGKGVKRMLRRDAMVRRLDEVWDALPVQLRTRFRKHTKWLYDAIFQEVRAHTFEYRLTENGVRVARASDGKLITWPMERYVPELVRAVRNSAHGLLDQLEGPHRFLLATHDGKLPPQLPELASLLLFGVIARAEDLFAQGWLPPVGTSGGTAGS